jgi:ABC-type polysaccharide/polyol phosphate export permease
MIVKTWVRRLHRWVAVAFTVSVIVVAIVLATQEEPAEWVYLSPLLPLGLLLITGAALFVQPYLAKRRRTRGATA